MAYNLAQLQQLTRQAGWPESLVEKAGSIWMYESSGIPNNNRVNSIEQSYGLAQINRKAWPQYSIAELNDPLTNLQIAYKIYRIQGWGAWYNSNNKYNANFQGIAAQGRAVYAATAINNQPINNTGSETPITTQIFNDPGDTSNGSDTSNLIVTTSPILILGVAVLAGLFVRNNY